jgi:hypothetical protein
MRVTIIVRSSESERYSATFTNDLEVLPVSILLWIANKLRAVGFVEVKND